MERAWLPRQCGTGAGHVPLMSTTLAQGRQRGSPDTALRMSGSADAPHPGWEGVAL